MDFYFITVCVLALITCTSGLESLPFRKFVQWFCNTTINFIIKNYSFHSLCIFSFNLRSLYKGGEYIIKLWPSDILLTMILIQYPNHYLIKLTYTDYTENLYMKTVIFHTTLNIFLLNELCLNQSLHINSSLIVSWEYCNNESTVHFTPNFPIHEMVGVLGHDSAL